MIRRLLAAAGAFGLAAAAFGMAASSAWAAPGERGGGSPAQHGTGAGLMPRSGEWWFSSWKILPRVWPLTQGVGVTVAVLDTGVQASVPDLRGVVLPGGDVTGHHTNGETDFNSGGDGHGTMIAVLIAGQGHGTGMVGVAPRAKILPVVVNAGASQMTSDPGAIAAGIIYAANHGARVIDVSQEYPAASASGCDRAEQAAVAYALARNIVVVAGAGDTNIIGDRPAEPASCAGVLAVGAVEPNRSAWPRNARQPYLTVLNPGADLISSGRNGRLLTGISGTRAASALAAGAVALIRSRYPAMPWYRVIQRVTGTALPAGGRVPNDSFGYGIFRLSEAVNAAAYPVLASAPDPVYAKYLAWLATPQGRSLSERLGEPASRKATARPPAAGSSAVNFIAILAVVAIVGVGVALAVRAGRRPGPRGNGRIRRPSGTTFPEPSGTTFAEPSGMTFPEPVGGPGRSRLDSELLEPSPPDECLPLGDPTGYRIPPYTPASGFPSMEGPPAPGGNPWLR
jgi:subtilisin family serine protease